MVPMRSMSRTIGLDMENVDVANEGNRETLVPLVNPFINQLESEDNERDRFSELEEFPEGTLEDRVDEMHWVVLALWSSLLHRCIHSVLGCLKAMPGWSYYKFLARDEKMKRPARNSSEGELGTRFDFSCITLERATLGGISVIMKFAKREMNSVEETKQRIQKQEDMAAASREELEKRKISEMKGTQMLRLVALYGEECNQADKEFVPMQYMVDNVLPLDTVM
eukprot:Gb_37258 [translate_table: standard]